MPEISSYRDLEAWQIGMHVVVEAYHVSADFPESERYGLTAQFRRASVSVPSNIAEGQARKSPRAFVHHLSIALGSLAEVDTQLEVAVRLGYVSSGSIMRFNGLMESCRRLTYGLRRSQRGRLGVKIGTSVIVFFVVSRFLG